MRSPALVVSGAGGANYNGALGDGTTGRHFAPVAVSGLSSGVTAVSAGHDSSCALLRTGRIKCWGEGYELTPTDVPGLSGVTAISSGFRVTCALTNAGGVKCWGGRYGPKPVDVPGLSSGVTAIATGPPSCVLTSGGRAKCWGADTNWSPVDVPGLGPGVTAIAAGGGMPAWSRAPRGVKCWGTNEFGQLGDGTTTDRSTPGERVRSDERRHGDRCRNLPHLCSHACRGPQVRGASTPKGCLAMEQRRTASGRSTSSASARLRSNASCPTWSERGSRRHEPGSCEPIAGSGGSGESPRPGRRTSSSARASGLASG